jgi:hypothetical protein
VSHSALFVVAAAVCFAVSLLADLSAVTTNANAWGAGGLFALCLSFVA